MYINKFQLLIKRILDLLGAGFAIILLMPIYLIIGLWIKLKTQGTAIFKHQRAGYKGETFTLYKFRTLYHDADISQDKGIRINDPRITPQGRFLRKWSLDELPQFYNVLMGNMSLVGPRPLLIEYVERYSMEQKKRLLMKPGLTGLQQVKARYGATWEAKFKLDVYYVEHYSLWLDIKIMFHTIKNVIILPKEAKTGSDSYEFKP